MKIVFASDIHGSLYYATKLLDRFVNEKADKLVILGDLYYHGPRNPLTEDYDPAEVAKRLNAFKHCLVVIKGNCDAEVDEMISEFDFQDRVDLDYMGKKITLTHGHKYNIDNIPDGCGDMLMYGHFHVPFIKEYEGRIVASPGSTSLPKQNSKHCYMVLENNTLTIKSLDGEIIMKKVVF